GGAGGGEEARRREVGGLVGVGDGRPRPARSSNSHRFETGPTAQDRKGGYGGCKKKEIGPAKRTTARNPNEVEAEAGNAGGHQEKTRSRSLSIRITECPFNSFSRSV